MPRYTSEACSLFNVHLETAEDTSLHRVCAMLMKVLSQLSGHSKLFSGGGVMEGGWGGLKIM